MAENNWEFGRRLTEAIDRRHMKYYRVAMECEISQPRLCHYCYGARMPRADSFMKIADRMNFSDEEIIYILKSLEEKP